MLPSHVALVSGGLDSLLVWCRSPSAVPVFGRLGHPYESAERIALHRIASVLPPGLRQAFSVREMERIDVAGLVQPNGFIPLRNLLLVAAVVAEGASDVALGSTLDDVHADNRAAFRRDFMRLLGDLLDRPIAIRAPLAHLTKGEAIRGALAADPTLAAAIRATRSCYSLRNAHVDGPTVGCGVCRACQRRREAWADAGFPPDRYDHEEG